MNGKKVFLKPGLRVVLDTHVLVEAVTQERAENSEIELRLLEQILSICSIIIVAPSNESEVYSQLSKRGLRTGPRKNFFALTSPLLGKLEAKKKLTKPAASKMRPFEQPVVSKLFAGRGHANISDDIHLFEAAAAHDRVVVTRDENILAQRAPISNELGVEVISPEDLLDAGGD